MPSPLPSPTLRRPPSRPKSRQAPALLAASIRLALAKISIARLAQTDDEIASLNLKSPLSPPQLSPASTTSSFRPGTRSNSTDSAIDTASLASSAITTDSDRWSYFSPTCSSPAEALYNTAYRAQPGNFVSKVRHAGKKESKKRQREEVMVEVFDLPRAQPGEVVFKTPSRPTSSRSSTLVGIGEYDSGLDFPDTVEERMESIVEVQALQDGACDGWEAGYEIAEDDMEAMRGQGMGGEEIVDEEDEDCDLLISTLMSRCKMGDVETRAKVRTECARLLDLLEAQDVRESLTAHDAAERSRLGKDKSCMAEC